MLTQDTKKHIDAARQILVGVVPNPMSQVEQITNALIYKFMDDMDQQAIKAGGDPSFFVKDLEKYAWTKVMDSRLGNQERMNLYTEALMKFSEAKQLPQLFRDIFKQAFLPYRDPEVLGLFLKEISYFDYTHSEELGNAYEYLLSIMSSQGDAGQFRTPRHIIDFIVDVLAPTKDDTILDPACGTAGFLISAYNYIKRQNEGVDPETGKMRQLTADERRKLVNNFEGYDVDPTMVRMSQVNMYLHKFTTPKIYNYNTLASEDRWNDKFDLILANPPFMSPKGGIKPHNKFSVQANRAEVLFVDYITNHLKPKGRAGIIVPEGIIFQSGKAYKELRKNLVNDGLFAVVSLPAGVFNPYSGVKTSILFFDNEVAKKTKDLLFVKVTSDGYDLGAQRRKIEKDDLGDAGVILKGFRTYVRNGENQETIESFINGSGKGFIVSKEKISETGDYNLSADRYRVIEESVKQTWPNVNLKDYVFLQEGPGIRSYEYDYSENGYPIINVRCVQDGYIDLTDCKKAKPELANGQWNHFKVEKGDILFTTSGTIGRVAIVKESNLPLLMNTSVVRFRSLDTNKLDNKYLYQILKSQKFVDELKRKATGIAQINVGPSHLKEMTIPLPPLEVQKEIVEQIEVKQKAIEGAKQVIGNLERERRYFGQSLRRLENIEVIPLGDIVDVKSGGTPDTKNREYYEPSEIAWLKSEVCKNEVVNNPETFISKNGLENSSAKLIPKNTTIVALVGATIGKTAFITFDFTTNQNVSALIVKDKDKLNEKYLFYVLRTIYDQFVGDDNKFKMANLSFVRSLTIPVPDMNMQISLVNTMDSQEEIIKSNKKLIEIMEEKIGEVLSEI